MIIIRRFIAILALTLFLSACKTEENLSECSDNVDTNYGLVLNAIRKNNYHKFSHYLNCIDDLNKKDKNGITLLMYSVGYAGVFSLPDFLRFVSGESRYFSDPYIFVSDLLKRGADTEIKDEQSATALGMASYHGRLGSVWVLLRYGANPNEIMLQNETPLMVSARNCYNDVYKLLIDFGGDVTLKNNAGESAEEIYSKCHLGK